MSWHFLQEQEEASWEGNSLDGAPSALLNMLHTHGAFSSPDSETGCLNPSQSGTMFALLMDTPGTEELILSRGDSLARTSAAPGKALVLTGSEADYGENSPALLARFDRDSYSWRIPQPSLFEAYTEFSEIWPRWGLMLAGACFPLAPLVPHIHGNDCGFWPTPRASDRDNCGGSNARKKAQAIGNYVGRNQNPQLQEWLMGWPIDWTDLRPAVMGRFQEWFSWHFPPYSAA